MKKSLTLILLLLFACSDNQISDFPNSTNPHDCFEYESEILDSEGSADAPKLSKYFSHEGPDGGIRWTNIEDAEYYILEECGCPDFTGYISFDMVDTNLIHYNRLVKDFFYRVKAVISPFEETGWSNVVKY